MANDLFAKDGTPNAAALRELRPSAKLVEEERLADELLEAKAGDDPERKDAAVRALDRWRTFWRTEREAAADQGSDDGVSAGRPDTIRAKATTNSRKASR